jgi:hypothetical protein
MFILIVYVKRNGSVHVRSYICELAKVLQLVAGRSCRNQPVRECIAMDLLVSRP